MYLMLGMPGTGLEAVKKGIDFAYSLGAKVSLSEFSPVPGTKIVGTSKKYLEEPLLQNNSVYPSFALLEWSDILSIKHEAHQLNFSLKDSNIS